MMDQLTNCCGFDKQSVHPMFGEAWHIAHRDHHVARWPDIATIDPGTLANLNQFIEDARTKAKP